MDPKVIATIVALAKEHEGEITSPPFSMWLANYPVPKEKWVPTEEYYWVNEGAKAKIGFWENDDIDHARRDGLGIYPTKEAAEAAAAKIREFVKGLNESV